MEGLILEGGTFRPIFSAGIMDALLDNNVIFPYTIGVSAGITNGVSYISKQKKRNLDILTTYRHDPRYIGIRNFFKHKSLFGLDFAYEEIPTKLNPFDMETYQSYKGKILIGVTNAKTGKSEYFDGKLLDNKCTLLKATCALPLFFPPININGELYYDGGICDPIPIKKSLSDGNKKHLIILTRPKEYRKVLGKGNKFLAKYFKHKYPNLINPLLSRHNLYNETVAFCEALEAKGEAIILRPNLENSVESFEKDIEKLKKSYDYGYNMAIENMDRIKELFN